MFFSIYSGLYKGKIIIGSRTIDTREIVSMLPKGLLLEIVLRNGEKIKVELLNDAEKVAEKIRKEIDYGKKIINITKFIA